MANNKVGHFIYGLKDRIWSDFICHFHLFNGRFAKVPISDSSWHADEVLMDLADRRPMAIKSSLGFLNTGSSLDNSSVHELSKFELVPIDHMAFSNQHVAEASTSIVPLIPRNNMHNSEMNFQNSTRQSHLESRPIIEEAINSQSLMDKFLMQEALEESQPDNFIYLGKIKCSLKAHYPTPPQCFLSSAFKYASPHAAWPPTLATKHKADLAQAQYSEKEISNLAANWAMLCARCLQWGHKKVSCHARVICINCSAPDHKAINFPLLHYQ